MMALAAAARRAPSPLAIDLALSRVALAALKAQNRKPIGSDEVAAASQLLEYFQHRLLGPSNLGPSLAKAVPQRIIRERLQETLASLPPVRNSLHITDTDLLQQLTTALTRLAVNGQLEVDDAERLLEALHEVEARHRVVPSAVDIKRMVDDAPTAEQH